MGQSVPVVCARVVSVCPSGEYLLDGWLASTHRGGERESKLELGLYQIKSTQNTPRS